MVNLVTFDDRPDVMNELTAELTKSFPEIVTVVNNITSKLANVAVGETEKVYYGTASSPKRSAITFPSFGEFILSNEYPPG